MLTMLQVWEDGMNCDFEKPNTCLWSIVPHSVPREVIGTHPNLSSVTEPPTVFSSLRTKDKGVNKYRQKMITNLLPAKNSKACGGLRFFIFLNFVPRCFLSFFKQ